MASSLCVFALMIAMTQYCDILTLNPEKPAVTYFFSKISPIADEVAHELGVQLRYFGSFHLGLENGHVWKSEGVFENEVLLPEYYDKVRNLSQRMFDIFTGIHDAFYHYTLKYIVKHEVHNFSNLVKTEGKILPPPLK